MGYEVLTKFRKGDLVRVKHDLDYFDPSVRGVAMEVLDVVREDVDGKEAVFYFTNKPDPVHGGHYNEFELVGANPPLQKDEDG